MKKFFKDFITLKRGYDLPANQRTKGSYPIYSANGINGYHSKFTSDSIGVITGRSGTIGTVMYSKTPYWALNTTLFVDDFKGNIPKYVYYFLNWFDLSRFSTGAVVPTLNRNHLDYIEIDVPDHETQLRITNILGSIDKKIEINKKKIEKLEALARDIYDYWFVQYDFPDKNGKPYKSSGGKLKLEHNFNIPKEFDIRPLGTILELLKDGTHNPPKRVKNGVPLLTGTMFGDIYLNYKDVTYISTENYLAIHSKYEAQSGDCILTKIGTIGAVNLLRKSDIPIAIHCNSALLRFLPEYSGAFSFCLLKADFFQKGLKAAKGQSIQEFVSLESISNIPIIIPKYAYISSFNRLCNPIFDEIERISYELNALEKQRKLILPLLMNGQAVVK